MSPEVILTLVPVLLLESMAGSPWRGAPFPPRPVYWLGPKLGAHAARPLGRPLSNPNCMLAWLSDGWGGREAWEPPGQWVGRALRG